MADWIKMRSGLLTNPRVIRMSRFLATSRPFINWWLRGTNRVTCDESVYEICDVTVVTRVTVASLLSVWSAVNEASQEDGFVGGITLIDVDEMAGVHGFGDAMLSVGWLEIADSGILFPNFNEHNTVGKARQDKRSSGAKSSAERTREWRERQKQKTEVVVTSDDTTSRDVSVTRHGDRREEKKREEVKSVTRTRSKTPLPANFGISDAVRKWAAEKGHDRLDEHLDSFVSKASAKGYSYVNWDSAFMEAIRGNWAKLPETVASNNGFAHTGPPGSRWIEGIGYVL
jgi:hypothetical protein